MCDGLMISDIDECEFMPDACPNGRCLNTMGSYRCACLDGYKADVTGKACVGKRLDSQIASTSLYCCCLYKSIFLSTLHPVRPWSESDLASDLEPEDSFVTQILFVARTPDSESLYIRLMGLNLCSLEIVTISIHNFF